MFVTISTKAVFLFSLVVGIVGSAYSKDVTPDNWTTLRVCADPNSMPLSNMKKEGFENKIAELFANDLGWQLNYKWFPQRLAFFRNTIRSKDPRSESGYACDIAIGASPDPEGALGTKTYYTSTWVMVIPDTPIFKNVKSSDDILAMDRRDLDGRKFGIFQGTPGADWVVKNGFAGQMMPFVRMQSDPNEYPGLIIEKNLARGQIDFAIAWGPIAAYSSAQVKDRKIRLVPLIGDKEMRTDYSIAMAVRYREPAWKKMVEAFISRRQDDINRIISGYGVPLVMADGSVVIGEERVSR